MMEQSLQILNNILKDVVITEEDVIVEEQNSAYEGGLIPSLQIRSRLAKVTPKKAGLFVAHYIKENGLPNRPYTVVEAVDTLAICIPKKGAFLFTKEILVQKGILSDDKTGKMGFRVYTPSETGLNKTAQKTQAWQAEFFHS